MSYSYPLTLPATKSPARITISANCAVTLSRSNWSYVSQVQEYDGQLWLAEISLPPMERADAAQWITFLLKLNGQLGTFLLGDQSASTPRGAASGTPRINGGSQSGQTLITDGWTHSITGILKAGDYIQVGQYLHMNLTDVNSDGSGNATLDIWPKLRTPPADNDAIITSSCRGLFRLSASAGPILDVNAAKNYDVSFSAVEAL